MNRGGCTFYLDNPHQWHQGNGVRIECRIGEGVGEGGGGRVTAAGVGWGWGGGAVMKKGVLSVVTALPSGQISDWLGRRQNIMSG